MDTRQATARLRVALAVCIGLWLVALVLPAIEVGSTRTMSGFDVLFQGSSAWRQGIFAWFANPLFVLAVAAGWFRFPRGAAALAALGLALGLTSLRAAQTARAGGVPVPDFSYAAGFYVWLGAQAALVLTSAWGLVARRYVAQS